MWQRTDRRRQSPATLAVLVLALGRPALLWAAPPEPAQPPPMPAGASQLTPDALLTRMQAAQRDAMSLSADFEQISRMKLFRQELHSTGRLLVRKPQAKGEVSRLRWEYLKPDASTLLLVGDTATLRMGTREPQVFDAKRDSTIGAIFGQLKLWLGQGDLASVQADYTVAVGGTQATPALLLVPKPDNPLSRAFLRVELHISGSSGLLSRLVLLEQSGDEKEIVFQHMIKNPRIPQGLLEK